MRRILESGRQRLVALAAPVPPVGWACLALTLLLGAYMFGHALRGYPLRPWDEARPAVSAAEMALNGNWLVAHFGGRPDLWNVKPPLLVWLQAASIQLFGISEGSVRLPTFAAAMATLLLLFGFAAWSLRNWRAGLLACAVLATSAGYVRWHVARTADADALLVLWVTAQLVFFFLYAEHGRARDWWLFTAALILAALTKGVAGLAALPAVAAYAFVRGIALPTLLSRRAWVSALLFLLVVGGYYVARDAASPGYLAYVWESELRDRVLSPTPVDPQPWSYHLERLWNVDFQPWIGILVVLLLLVPWRRHPLPAAEGRAAVLILLFVATWLIVVSAVGTRLPWYSAPIFPPLALLTGLSLAHAWGLLKAKWTRPSRPRHIGVAIALLLFAPPALIQAARIENEGGTVVRYRFYRDYLAGIAGTPLGRQPLTLLVPTIPRIGDLRPTNPSEPTPSYEPVFEFYRLAFADRGLRFTTYTTADIAALRPSDLVLVCDRETEQAFHRAYVSTPVQRTPYCLVARIEAARDERVKAGRAA